MSEGNDRVRQLLAELDSLLGRSEDLDEDSKGALRDVATRIGSTLDSGGVPSESVVSGLRERLERFEGKHPRLTDALGRLADQLSEMGI